MSNANARRETIRKVCIACALVAFGLGSLGFRVSTDALTSDAGQLSGSGRAAVIAGLVGKSQSQLAKLSGELDELLAQQPRSLADIREPFERLLGAHETIAQDLRTVFGLAHTGPGASVAGSDDPERPTGFYNATLAGFLALNGRLAKTLEDLKETAQPSDAERYGEELLRARSMVTSRRGTAKAME